MNRICEQYEELVSRSLDAPLVPGEARDLEQHLQGCPACREFRGDLLEMLDELEREAGVGPRERDLQELGDRVMASIAARSQESEGRGRRRWFGLGTLVAGLAAAALLVATLLQESREPGARELGREMVTKVTGLEVLREGQTWSTPDVPSAGPISTLHLRDGSRIEMEGHTVLRFAEPGAGYRSRMELRQGRLTAHVSKAAGRFVVETASGSVEALGTDFALGVSRNDAGSLNEEGETGMQPQLPVNVVMTLAVLTGSVLVHTSWGQEKLVQGDKREITSWALRGRIVDPAGKPIVGARVWAANNSPYQTAYIATSTQIAWRKFGEEDVHRTPGILGPFTKGPATTDAQGKFLVKNLLSPMGGSLSVLHTDYLPLHRKVDRKSVRRGGDGLLDVGTLVLARGVSLRGRVVDGGGHPVAQAKVAIVTTREDGEDGPRLLKFVRSDEQGRFRIRGLAEKEEGRILGVWDANSPAVSVELASPLDKKELVLTLLRAKPGNRIRARVINAEDGSPMAACVVRLLRVGPAGPYDRKVYEQRRSDQRGRAEFGCVPDGEFVVQAVPADQAKRIGIHSPPPWAVSQVAAPGSDVELAVMPAIRIEGSVVDAATGEPIPRYEVRALPDPSTFDQAYRKRFGHPDDQRLAEGPRPGGVFALPSMRSGKWKIQILANGYRPFEKAAEVELRPRQERLVFRVEKATGSVVGHVVDAGTGQPVADALVDAYEWSPILFGVNRRYSKSDAEGHFRATRLVLDEDLAQTFWISRSGYLRKELAFAKGTLPPKDLGRIELVRECVITGQLLDAKGKPLDRVTVVAREEAFRSKGGRRVLTDHQGRYRLEGLRVGIYHLRALGKQIEQVEFTKPGTTRSLDPHKL